MEKRDSLEGVKKEKMRETNGKKFDEKKIWKLSSLSGARQLRRIRLKFPDRFLLLRFLSPFFPVSANKR